MVPSKVIFLFTGHSGSGKTTLNKTVAEQRNASVWQSLTCPTGAGGYAAPAAGAGNIGTQTSLAFASGLIILPGARSAGSASGRRRRMRRRKCWLSQHS